MRHLLSIFDILLPPFYIIGMYSYGYYITKKKIRTNPEYEYFTRGLLTRVFGAMALGLIYFFYYKGGDTTNYYESATAYVNLFYENKSHFLEGWLGNPNWKTMSTYFNENTGYPVYFHRDSHSFFVVRLLIPIMALSFNSYFACAIMVGAITYGGLWKLYQTFLEEFPNLKKEFAIACLFIPSCVFWGSGLMKDSFTISAVGWFTFAFYRFFIKKQRKMSYGIY